MEVWLQPNRRVLYLAMIPTGLLVVIGGLLLAMVSASLLKVLSWVLIVLGVLLLVGLVGQLRRPRIAYANHKVLFFLRARQPVAVPVEHVEAFFLGQGPTNLPAGSGQKAETVNLVARISQKAPEWAEVEVKQALGNWKEGYATIRGTWCEQLTSEVIRRLNHRLREVTQASEQAPGARDEHQP